LERSDHSPDLPPDVLRGGVGNLVLEEGEKVLAANGARTAR